MDEKTQDKQAFLRDNILNEGYDADEFMKFLQEYKGENALDLSEWNLVELENVVKEFKKLNPLKDNANKDNNNNFNSNYNDNNTDNNIKEIKNDNNNIDNNNNNIIEPPNKNINNNEYFPCKLNEQTEFKNKKITITVSSPELIDGGIFKKPYISYLVKTEPFKFSINRRFSDFVWLQNILSKNYINCIIPPLSVKKYFKSTEELIFKRVRMLNRFMDGISNQPLLINSQILYDFLSMKDKEFKSTKNIYDKLPCPTKVNYIKTNTGEIAITITEEKENISKKIKQYSENNIDLMKKLTKNYKILKTQMQIVVNKIKDIANIWDSLYKSSNKNLEGDIISGVYDIMAKFSEDLSNTQKKQITFIDEDIREYIRFIRKEYENINNYCDETEAKKNNYNKSYLKLKAKKETLFQEKKVEKWGLDRDELDNQLLLFKDKELSLSKMLPEETKQVDDAKKLYGSYLNSLIEEYQRIRKLNTKRHKEACSKFIKNFSENIANYYNSLTQLVAYVDVLKEDNIY